MDSMEDVNFKNPKLKFTPEEFKEIAEKIRRVNYHFTDVPTGSDVNNHSCLRGS